ncbi:hypothetical protein VII00023_13767 [Vibrio ichthyoenteri ATCC 700023]|uniref:Uncharacterized protein n=1 Tax=Vibrio ichthyoenteri ATCC 700023 TaxID=870968 RepID=F9RWW7_9VIBR|nr:hypothetical protein VII00023_13767 [Vibrio ichthyoenteri ATCC 700023]
MAQQSMIAVSLISYRAQKRLRYMPLESIDLLTSQNSLLSRIHFNSHCIDGSTLSTFTAKL